MFAWEPKWELFVKMTLKEVVYKGFLILLTVLMGAIAFYAKSIHGQVFNGAFARTDQVIHLEQQAEKEREKLKRELCEWMKRIEAGQVRNSDKIDKILEQMR